VLGALEERHPNDPLVVIGVHSAKFPAERDPERIREAMRRHGVRHPVIVDEGFTIWQSYTIRAWPSLVLIRPDGSVAGIAPGEPSAEKLEEAVEEILEEARQDGSLAEKPFRVEPSPEDETRALCFPGKVIPLPGGGLAVSDSGHHRILVLSEDGAVRSVVGSGEPGLADGPFDAARFTRPQGMAADERTLYVADTGNHALRAIDLEKEEVITLAGDGTLARALPRGFQHAPDVRLRSPWDLAKTGPYLLIAMAGIHQIWLYLPEEKALAVLAGTGAESIDDGDFFHATFSQPTGLAADGEKVYVADSETSAVRSLDLSARTVRTLVGKGLFEFGDVDGLPDRARLQHVQGVSVGPHGLLVADTYNDKLKRVDTETGEVTTWYGAQGPLGLSEPGGLCQLADGRVIVADTNRHRLLVVDGAPRSARVLHLTQAAAPNVESSRGGPA
jgi:sugar lactone lactonase YvrE